MNFKLGVDIESVSKTHAMDVNKALLAFVLFGMLFLAGCAGPGSAQNPASGAQPTPQPETQKQVPTPTYACPDGTVVTSLSNCPKFIDSPSNEAAFNNFLAASPKVVLFYDLHNATNDEQNNAVYQRGVDLISSGKFAGKTLVNVACDSNGCSDGTNALSYEQVLDSVSSVPYIIIKPGPHSGNAYFIRHMEIYIASEPTSQPATQPTQTTTQAPATQASQYPSFVVPNIAPKTTLSPKEGVFPTREEYAAIDSTVLEKNSWGDYSASYGGSCSNVWRNYFVGEEISPAGFKSGCLFATDRSLSASNPPVSIYVFSFDTETSSSAYYSKRTNSIKTSSYTAIDLDLSLGNDARAYKGKPNYWGRQEYGVYFRRNNVVSYVSVNLQTGDDSGNVTSILKYLANLVDYKLVSQSS